VLKTLSVNNFALLEQATVVLGAGLNVLTGETGAGKSIIVDALDIVLGSRAYVESIRSGCDFLRIEAVFEINPAHPATLLLADNGILLEDDSGLIISRRLSRQGKNTILVNGCHVTLSVLRKIGDSLVDMHGQHENQTLLKSEAYLNILDEYHHDIPGKLAEYRKLYAEWNHISSELDKLKSDSCQRAQRLDMLEWQTKEIAVADLKENEEEELEQEVRLLTNAEKITAAVSHSYALLSDEEGGGGVLSVLAEIQKGLEQACRFDATIEKHLVVINEAFYQLEDSAAGLRDYCEQIEYDPNRLTFLQERLDVIDNLKKKYGPTVAEIIAYYQQSITELAAIENYETSLSELEKRLANLESSLAIAALELTAFREAAATEISLRVTDELKALAMPKAKLVIQVIPLNRYTINGINEVTVLFSANPGEEPKPLQKIASGGELSRIALAIKTVVASRESVGTMVFDEIDAGIGGQTAAKVAEKIAEVSCGKQVLCITHLPQIVTMADHHIYVAKKVDGERTTTRVSILSKRERIEEVARMLSGEDITSAALKNAQEMLELAVAKKTKKLEKSVN